HADVRLSSTFLNFFLKKFVFSDAARSSLIIIPPLPPFVNTFFSKKFSFLFPSFSPSVYALSSAYI
ncbi:MAG TPA: hypothetical protein H9840_07100, partial [Candidatus Anaerofilum excrementigallinarum]|nr:hypothetical protein [Candidatus Anaerofilum excrementigallinarum]